MQIPSSSVDVARQYITRANSSRWGGADLEQLDQFTSQYFEDLGFDVAYGDDLGEASRGYFAEAGKTTSRGTYYERDTLVIGEKAFKEGWDVVGTTIFHEWLHGIDPEFEEEQARELEILWRDWYNQNR